jgi:hypothetical protein
MRRFLGHCAGLAAALLLLTTMSRAEPSDSATRDAARSLGLSGIEAFQAGNYELASGRLEKAYALLNVPSLGLWSARALAKRNQLVEAAARYFEVTALQLPEGDAAIQRQAQVDAQQELDQLRPDIPELSIRFVGAAPNGVSLLIDGKTAPANDKPRLLNPGPHQIEATSGAITRTSSVGLALGQHASIELDFSPPKAPQPEHPATPAAPPPAKSSPQRTWGWVGLGAGAAGVGFGGIMGALALKTHSDIASSGDCSDSTCPAGKRDAVDQLDRYRLLSSIGFIAGGALAATGIVLVVSAPKQESQITGSFSPGGVLVTGRF